MCSIHTSLLRGNVFPCIPWSRDLAARCKAAPLTSVPFPAQHTKTLTMLRCQATCTSLSLWWVIFTFRDASLPGRCHNQKNTDTEGGDIMGQDWVIPWKNSMMPNYALETAVRHTVKGGLLSPKFSCHKGVNPIGGGLFCWCPLCTYCKQRLEEIFLSIS